MSLENSPSFLLNFSEREMNGEAKHFYRFKSFRLDVGERQLLNEGEPVALTPKAFDVLAALVERGGHLIEKDELLKTVWADSFVEEANIPRIVHTLRRVLGEDDNGNKFIETVAKKGYRFVAGVDEIYEPTAPKSVNGKQDFSIVAEDAPETIAAEKTSEVITAENTVADFQIAPSATAATAAPSAVKQKNTTRIMLFAVGFASAVFLILMLSFNWQSKSSFDPNEPQSIAVLPLKSLTAENRDALYELGAADALILKLSSAKNLTVRPLSATQGDVDGKKDAVAIGKEQQVNFILASNYQIADGKIRITSQLINVSNGAVEETFKDEQNISNTFAVQDAFAANVSQKLLTRLNRTTNNVAAKRFTANEEAYRLYLQGRALTDKRSRKDAEKAVEYLEQAVRIDPNYALAYAQLANAYSASASFGGDSIEKRLKQKSAVEKALAIDENLPEAYAMMGEMKMNYEWDFDGAEKAFKKAVELDPNSIKAHRLFALYLSSMGRHDEAIAEAKTAVDLEPASVLNHKNLGQFLYYARRYDEAIAESKLAVEMDANFRVAYGWLIGSYRMKGENDQAFEWFLRAPQRKDESPEKIQSWKEIYAKSGWRGITEREIEEVLAEEKNGKPHWNLSGLYAELGDKEKAIVSLEKAFSVNERGWGWTTLKISPRYDLIRSDPRFEAIVKRVGLK